MTLATRGPKCCSSGIHLYKAGRESATVISGWLGANPGFSSRNRCVMTWMGAVTWKSSGEVPKERSPMSHIGALL